MQWLWWGNPTLTCLPSGDLSNEQEVLEWLLEQKNSDTIEEVTDEILDDLIANFEYVVVYFSESQNLFTVLLLFVLFIFIHIYLLCLSYVAHLFIFISHINVFSDLQD